ncbi:DUF4326 domain-containing protein [Xylophilus sp. GOD-11R]|uniref:DUF4326 domain-containing protein n=1 Tax=Xylophilus sp. GOD-11R TaxID=3089814 RepID=UPI00298CF206|nr:DUF4326 domain-containing protein [Xylophilus sp. GOD-11R]WPB58599.1 DUF4326 domain-containing protein [Xylophilus sp. GOD-11R]
MTKHKTTEPVRIHLSRAAGWRMPADTVKVDRSTIWGNPFRVGDTYVGTHGEQLVKDNAMAVVLFRDLVERQGGYMAETKRQGNAWVSLADIRRELRGKNLACWCKAGTPCHADVLIELANEEQKGGA